MCTGVVVACEPAYFGGEFSLFPRKTTRLAGQGCGKYQIP